MPFKSNKIRSVYKAACDNGEAFFIKHLSGAGLREHLKTYIRDKAREEYDASRQLREAGIDAAEVCAIGNRGRERFLVSHNCPGVPAGQFWDEILSQEEPRQAFIAALQAFVISLLENNVRHQDLHLGNLICQPGDGSYAFTLIDVYGTAVDDAINIDDQVEVMAPMRTGLMLLNRAERQQMWRDTSAAARQPTDYFRTMVYGNWRRQALRRYKRRRVKYLRQSSIIDSHQVADGHLRFFGDRVSGSVVAGAVRQHQVAEARGELFKQKQKRSISKSTVEGRAVVVKGFRLDRLSASLSRDQRNWLNGARLLRYAIPCVKYLGWLRQASTAYIVMVDGGSNTFDNELAAIVDDRETVMRRLSQLGALVAHMHEMGVHFKDLKTSNIIIDPGTDGLILIDLDDVRFYQKLTPRGIRDNLQVLFASLSPVLSGLIRCRVLTVYAAERGFLRAAYRDLYHSLDFDYQA